MGNNNRTISILGIMAVIFYNSWIFALFLNLPYFGRQTSDLQNAGQPYDWFFVLCDVIAGILVMLITFLLLVRSYKLSQKWMGTSLTGYSFFGILTALSALVLQNNKLQSLRFHEHIHRVSGVHDLIGGLAAFSLFISMFAIYFILFQKKQHLEKILDLVLTILVIWVASGVLFFILPQGSLLAIILQRVFIFSSSIWVYLMPQILIKLWPQKFL